jgi:hypothetical protein
MTSVERWFEAELRRRSIGFTRRRDGRYDVSAGGVDELVVSLDNLARDVARDGDRGAIARFVDALRLYEDSRTWEEVRPYVFLAAEPKGLDVGDAVRSSASAEVDLVLAVTDEDERVITFVTQARLEAWNVSREDAEQAAGENLDRLLLGKQPEVKTIEAMRLGMLPVASAFKASLIFAPHFRQFVEPCLGWPVLAVTPCRDFVFVFPAADSALVARTGRLVLEEYEHSGYPITPEVWRVSDAGVQAVGSFRAPLEAADGLTG